MDFAWKISSVEAANLFSKLSRFVLVLFVVYDFYIFPKSECTTAFKTVLRADMNGMQKTMVDDVRMELLYL